LLSCRKIASSFSENVAEAVVQKSDSYHNQSTTSDDFVVVSQGKLIIKIP